MQLFELILIVFLVYSSLRCYIMLVNITAIEECDKHHLSCCRLLSDFLFPCKRLVLSMCTFFPIRGPVRSTFVAFYYFLKQICLLLECLKPFLANLNTSHHLFVCAYDDDKRRIWRFGVKVWWMVNLIMFVMCSRSWTVRYRSSLIITLIIFTLICKIWLTVVHSIFTR